MPPPSGNYYIKNRASGYYLSSTQTQEAALGLVVTEQVEGDLTGEYSFSVERDPDTGLFLISANFSGSYIVPPQGNQDQRPLAWSAAGQRFRILDDGGGFYNLRLVDNNRFWYDDTFENQPFRSVLLRTGKGADTTRWSFQVANN